MFDIHKNLEPSAYNFRNESMSDYTHRTTQTTGSSFYVSNNNKNDYDCEAMVIPPPPLYYQPRSRSCSSTSTTPRCRRASKSTVFGLGILVGVFAECSSYLVCLLLQSSLSSSSLLPENSNDIIGFVFSSVIFVSIWFGTQGIPAKPLLVGVAASLVLEYILYTVVVLGNPSEGGILLVETLDEGYIFLFSTFNLSILCCLLLVQLNSKHTNDETMLNNHTFPFGGGTGFGIVLFILFSNTTTNGIMEAIPNKITQLLPPTTLTAQEATANFLRVSV